MSKIAFVFPGQGSQQVGMFSDFISEYSVVRDVFGEASEALGYDVSSLVIDGPAEELNKTEKTQPAILTCSTALYRLWQSEVGLNASMFAGHSLGEYSALVASGVLEFVDAVKLVALRGQLMQEAVPQGQGKMAAILGLSDEQVVDGCVEAAQDQIVSAVNFNTAGQVVIAGSTAAVDRAMVILKEKGAKRTLPLPVSVPSHCALMKPAADKLAEHLKAVEFKEPAAPVVQNRNATPASNIEVIKTNLLEQLYMPVLWTKSVEFIASSGIDELVECGPGKVLTGLNKRIAKSLSHSVIGDLASFQSRKG